MDDTSPYYQHSRIDVAPLLPQQYSKVLEIGCGEGNFRDNLDQPHEYWGVEPVESAATTAAEKLDKVLIGTYEEVADEIPEDYFDLVVCCDVMEHMADHEAFLRSIKGKLTADGCMVASVPNVRYLLHMFELLVRKDWEYKDEGILDRTHQRFFTKQSLRRVIADSGFVIDELVGLNPLWGKGLTRCLYSLAIVLLGQDTRFVQFGVRIRRAEETGESPKATP